MKYKLTKLIRGDTFLPLVLCTLGSIGIARIANLINGQYNTANLFLVLGVQRPRPGPVPPPYNQNVKRRF